MQLQNEIKRLRAALDQAINRKEYFRNELIQDREEYFYACDEADFAHEAADPRSIEDAEFDKDHARSTMMDTKARYKKARADVTIAELAYNIAISIAAIRS